MTNERDVYQELEEAISVPDDDPRLKGAQAGECQRSECGRFMYVRQSDWLSLISQVSTIITQRHGKPEQSIFG